MRISPNVRPRCDGSTTPVTSTGGCFNYANGNTSEADVKVWNNVTRVNDWDTASANPNGIPPYTRKHNNHPTDFSCFPPDFDCCEDYTQEFPCCEVPDPLEIMPCGTGTSSVAYLDYHDCYAPTTESVQSPCSNMGWKGALARKAWNGQFGYLSQHWQADDFINYCGDNQCRYIDYKPTPDTTKYLSLSATAEKHVNTVRRAIGGDGINTAASANQSVNIDRYSGYQHVTSCASSSNATDPDTVGYEAAEIFNKLGDANSSIANLEANYVGITISNYTAFGQPVSVVRGGPNAFTVTWDTADDCGGTHVAAILIVNIAAGTLRSIGYGYDGYIPGCPHAWAVNSDETWVYSMTGFSYTEAGIFWSESIIQTTSISVAGSLGTPYTAQQAYQDAVDLLDKMPLTNDIQMPWRLDQLVTRLPKIEYDEVSLAAPSVATPCNLTPQTTGKIIGLPNPPGYGPFWNPVMEVWQTCVGQCGDSSMDTFWYLDTIGEYSLGAVCATNWSNAFESQFQLQGAYAGMNFQYTIPNCGGPPIRVSDDVIYVAKYSEIQVPKPSINFARPCGFDRWAVEQASGSCIQDVVGNTVTVLDTSGLHNGTASICGTGDPTIDGYWTITVNTDTVLSLNHLVASASTFPQSWDCGSTGVITMLRWPLAPPICGRNYITNTTGSPVTCSLDDESFLITGDQIWAVDKNGVTTNQTVTVLDQTTIVFNGTIPPVVPFDYVTARFAKDWRWNDNASKGDFVIIDDYYDFRDIGEYNRLIAQSQSVNSSFECDGVTPCSPSPLIAEPRPYQAFNGLPQEIAHHSCSTHCLTPSPCAPPVICISPSPHVDKFPNGYTHQLKPLVGDSDYGSLNRGTIKQHDTDPFAEPPPCDCRANSDLGFNVCDFFFVEDDGTCANNDDFNVPNTHYYPHLPLVEARCKPPVGAPQLPADALIGCLSQPEIDVPHDVRGNVCAPPWFGEFGYMAWVLWNNMENCVCSDPPGRFADEYAATQDIFCVPAP